MSQEKECIMCDNLRNYYLKDSTCFCDDGYVFNEQGDCVDQCGDGRIFTSPCDDGNNRDGDGCSSTCQIETYFRCFGGSINISSICSYIGQSFGLQLFRIFKKHESNTGVFVFTITKWIPLVKYIDFLVVTIFNTAQMKVVREIMHDRGKIYVEVEYFEDLEGRTANFSVNLDPYFLISRHINMSFSMVSDTSPLVILDYPSTDHLMYLKWILLASVCLAAFILIMGSQLHKMVGLQTIVVFQTCFFLPFSLTDSSIVLDCFKLLTFSMGYGKQFFYDEGDKYLNNFNTKLQISKQSLQIMGLNSSYLLGVTLLLIITGLIASVSSMRKKKYKINHKIVSKIYHRMLFPVSMAFFSINFISLLSNNLRVYELKQSTQIIQTTQAYNQLPKIINITHIFIVIIIINGIAFLQMVMSFRYQQQNVQNRVATKWHPVRLLMKYPDEIKARPTYIGLFLIKLMITDSLIISSIALQAKTSIYYLTFLFLLQTVFIVVYKPYEATIHKAGLLFGQLTLVLFCSGLSVKQYFINTHRALPLIYELIYAAVIAVMLLTFDILSFTRLIYENIQERKGRSKQVDEQDEYLDKIERSKYDKLIARKWKIEDDVRQEMTFEERKIDQNDELKQIKSRLRKDLSIFIREGKKIVNN